MVHPLHGEPQRHGVTLYRFDGQTPAEAFTKAASWLNSQQGPSSPYIHGVNWEDNIDRADYDGTPWVLSLFIEE